MRFRLRTVGLREATRSLTGANDRIQAAWLRDGKSVGDDAVAYIQTEFRSGPTNDKSTQVRRGQLRRAYSSVSKPGARKPLVEVDVGLIRPGLGAEVLRHGRLQEGFDRAGNRFTSLNIRAKAGGLLTFPIFDPNSPGVAKSNIIGWARVRKVTFRPHPSFPAVKQKFAPILQARARETLIRIVGGRAA